MNVFEKLITDVSEWANKIEVADWASIISAICSTISLVTINVGDDHTHVEITEWEENTILQKSEETCQEK